MSWVLRTPLRNCSSGGREGPPVSTEGFPGAERAGSGGGRKMNSGRKRGVLIPVLWSVPCFSPPLRLRRKWCWPFLTFRRSAACPTWALSGRTGQGQTLENRESWVILESLTDEQNSIRTAFNVGAHGRKSSLRREGTGRPVSHPGKRPISRDLFSPWPPGSWTWKRQQSIPAFKP